MNTLGKYRIAVLRNEYPDNHLHWVNACNKFSDKVEYRIINIISSDWLDKISGFNPELCLLKPSAKTSLYRNLYQERIDIIVHELGLNVYPSFNELRIYENKRFFSYWAKANNVPHPETWVFYDKKEVIEFLDKAQLPLVGKTNIGASGDGIKIFTSRIECLHYIQKAFGRGLSCKTGPKLSRGNVLNRILEKIKRPAQLSGRLKKYKDIASDKQKGFVILQEYIRHEYEWRAVRIGDSFFAHKKLLHRGKASGSLKKGYENPPLELLDFIRDFTDQHNFYSVAIDLFESGIGDYLINEVQCIFGQSDSFQMLVNGEKGRYTYIEGMWRFEQGDFNLNGSYDLRLQHAISLLDR